MVLEHGPITLHPRSVYRVNKMDSSFKLCFLHNEAVWSLVVVVETCWEGWTKEAAFPMSFCCKPINPSLITLLVLCLTISPAAECANRHALSFNVKDRSCFPNWLACHEFAYIFPRSSWGLLAIYLFFGSFWVPFSQEVQETKLNYPLNYP